MHLPTIACFPQLAATTRHDISGTGIRAGNRSSFTRTGFRQGKTSLRCPSRRTYGCASLPWHRSRCQRGFLSDLWR